MICQLSPIGSDFETHGSHSNKESEISTDVEIKDTKGKKDLMSKRRWRNIQKETATAVPTEEVIMVPVSMIQALINERDQLKVEKDRMAAEIQEYQTVISSGGTLLDNQILVEKLKQETRLEERLRAADLAKKIDALGSNLRAAIQELWVEISFVIASVMTGTRANSESAIIDTLIERKTSEKMGVLAIRFREACKAFSSVDMSDLQATIDPITFDFIDALTDLQSRNVEPLRQAVKLHSGKRIGDILQDLEHTLPKRGTPSGMRPGRVWLAQLFENANHTHPGISQSELMTEVLKDISEPDGGKFENPRADLTPDQRKAWHDARSARRKGPGPQSDFVSNLLKRYREHKQNTEIND